MTDAAELRARPVEPGGAAPYTSPLPVALLAGPSSSRQWVRCLRDHQLCSLGQVKSGERGRRVFLAHRVSRISRKRPPGGKIMPISNECGGARKRLCYGPRPPSIPRSDEQREMADARHLLDYWANVPHLHRSCAGFSTGTTSTRSRPVDSATRRGRRCGKPSSATGLLEGDPVYALAEAWIVAAPYPDGLINPRAWTLGRSWEVGLTLVSATLRAAQATGRPPICASTPGSPCLVAAS